MKRARYALAGALALEAGASLLLDGGRAAAPRVLAWALLHAAASGAGALALAALLPARLRAGRGHAAVLAFLFGLCIPLFGMAGAALVLRTLARQDGAGAAGAIDLYRPADEPHALAAGEPARRFAGAGSLVNVIKHGGDRQDRLCALIATQSLDDRHAAPVLQAGVRDGDDDVRLLAYSLLMKKQKALENRLTQGQRALDGGAAGNARLPLHLAMAHHCWDMQQLTPDSGAATPWLDQAALHVEAGLALAPAHADLLMLRGMMALRACQPERADHAFAAAAAAGVAPATLAPWRAESAFYRRASAATQPAHFPEMLNDAAA